MRCHLPAISSLVHRVCPFGAIASPVSAIVASRLRYRNDARNDGKAASN